MTVGINGVAVGEGGVTIYPPPGAFIVGDSDDTVDAAEYGTLWAPDGTADNVEVQAAYDAAKV